MTVPEIDVRTAQQRASAGEVLLLDVREDDEWVAGSSGLSEHRSLSTLQVADVPTDRPVYAICRSGGRSGKAAQVLQAAGVDVTNVAGGMKAWAEAGLDVICDSGPGVVT